MYVLKLNAVIGMTGLSRSTIYLYMKTGQFPQAVKLGLRSVGWVKDEVEEWLAERMNSR